MPRRTTVNLRGRELDGELAEFTSKEEHWNEYELADGGLVRVRIVVSEIIVCDEKNDDGNPLVVVKSSIIVSHQPQDA